MTVSVRAGLAWSAVLAGVLTLSAAHLQAQSQASTGKPPSSVSLKTGKEIWEAGCASCHGADGRGAPDNLRGFEVPDTFPDFSDCPTSAVESNVQWRAVITNGGPARGFSQIMPSFKDLLTQEQIGLVINHVRTLCTDTAWPLGDLNLPKPLITEKAFPENETVITTSVNTQGAAAVDSKVTYEHRVGSRAMWEVTIPYGFSHENGTWGTAFGDLVLGYKQTLAHSMKKGSILSVGGEMVVPTGNRQVGTGGESTIFETYLAYGQVFKGQGFVQFHSGIELPVHQDEVPKAYYLRTAIGKMFATDGGHGRRWTPMVEFIGDRDVVKGEPMNWDIVPELQVPLNKRLHVLAGVGYRMPMNNKDGRPRQFMFYGLWDWMDGGLLQGW
ncbi:MAG: cytochrome c [Vicinamibacterales bacterium]